VPGHGDSSCQAQPRAASPPATTAQRLPRYVGHRRRLPPGAPLFEYADLERQLALRDAAVQVGDQLPPPPATSACTQQHRSFAAWRCAWDATPLSA
jgi:hypothetical protein